MVVVLGGIWGGQHTDFYVKVSWWGCACFQGTVTCRLRGRAGITCVVQKSEIGVQRLKTWLAASTLFLQLD